ncbi:MAG: C1 family peptidase [Brumimicrobium sp.]|nr:C1 family peptidase [Brumimicrobium sp.]
MKKICIILGVLILSTYGTIAQTTTNIQGSNYAFTKVASMEASPVVSQGNTGTCWSFSALSFFESEMMRKGFKNTPILSQMYIARKAYEGKADYYIQMDGKANFSQGGAFHDIPFVFRNYGIVPNSVYSGLNYGLETHNHQELFSAIEGYMNGVLSYVNNKGNKPLSKQWKVGLNGILDAYLGKDPERFTYEGKEYTPKSFAEYTKLNMDDYVSITSFQNMPVYEKGFLRIQDNWEWGSVYNVTLDDLVKITEEALKNGYTVAWGADVSEKGFNFRKGLAIVPEDESTIQVAGKDNRNYSDAGADKNSDAFMTPVKELTITPELRQEAYDNKTTTDDHGMHITGLFQEANGTYFFLVKNSWGTSNYPEGYLYVSENYFKYKTINIYLHKDAVPKDIAKKLNLK